MDGYRLVKVIDGVRVPMNFAKSPTREDIDAATDMWRKSQKPKAMPLAPVKVAKDAAQEPQTNPQAARAAFSQGDPAGAYKALTPRSIADVLAKKAPKDTRPEYQKDLDSANQQIGTVHGKVTDWALRHYRTGKPLTPWEKVNKFVVGHAAGLASSVLTSPLDIASDFSVATDPYNKAPIGIRAGAAANVALKSGAIPGAQALRLGKFGVRAVRFGKTTAAAGDVLEQGLKKTRVPVGSSGHTDIDAVLNPQPPKEQLGPVEINSGLNLRQMAEEIGNKNQAGQRVHVTVGHKFRNTFIENLSSTKELSPAAREGAIKVGASRAQAGLLVRVAGPAIEQAAGVKGYFPKVRQALVESRLRGLKQRWEDMASDLRGMSDAQFQKDYPNLHEDLADRLGVGKDIQSDITSGNVDAARNALADAYADASTRVTSVMPDPEFQSLTKAPEFAKALKVYKDNIEKPIAQSHASNEGVFSNALGPLDTYYPLAPLDAAGKPLRQANLTKRLPFGRPKNTHNAFATGLAAAYDTSTEGLANTLSSAVKTNNRAAMIDTLEAQGLIKSLTPAQRAALPDNPTIMLGGQEFAARVVETKPNKIIIQDGKQIVTPAKTALVPEFLHQELKPALEGHEGSIPGLMHKINTFGMVGPLDAFFHSNNLIGAMTTGTPYVGKSLLSKTIGNTPFTKRLNTVYQIIRTNTSDAAALSDLQDMANAGALPSRFGSTTYSKRFAEAGGAKVNRLSFGPLLYGPSGMDIRARLHMWRIAKEVMPNAKPGALADFVNQLGAYNPVLEARIERALKHSGTSPFFTAGKTMWLNGVRSWLGKTKIPLEGASPFKKAKLISAQQVSGGAVGFIATWATAHHALTGKWPWEDKDSKFGKLPVPDSVRKTAVGKRIFGDKPGTAYVNMAFFNPIVDRGARALGIRGTYDTAVLGGTAAQSVDAGFKDVLNSAAHPFVSGPAFQGGFTALTGHAPYVTRMRDSQGKQGWELAKVTPDVGGGGTQIASNIEQGLVRTNSALANLGESTGLMDEPYYKKTGDQDVLQGVLSIAFPSLFVQPQDNEKRAEGLRTQATGTETELAKQQGKFIPQLTDATLEKFMKNEAMLARPARRPNEPLDAYHGRVKEWDTVLRKALTARVLSSLPYKNEKSSTARTEMLKGAMKEVRTELGRDESEKRKAKKEAALRKQIKQEKDASNQR